MTTSQPEALPAVSSELTPETTAESCACIVASYAGAASLVFAATEDAARRIMMTPALGDFVELCFVNIGPEPGRSGDHSTEVQLITEAVLAAGGEAASSDFAIVVAGRSAAAVEAILAQCDKSPFLGQLPMRLHGIAAADDRGAVQEIADGQVTVAGPGAWGHGFLVDELRRYADELMRYFAVTQEGVTQDELDSLRARYEQQAECENGAETLGLPVAVPHETAVPPQGLVTSSTVPPAPQAAPRPPEPPPSPRRPDSTADASPPQAELPQPITPASAPEQAASSTHMDSGPNVPSPEETRSAPARPRLRRLLPVRWRGGNPSEPATAAESITNRAAGLAYLLVIGDTLADDPIARQHSRSTLLAVDQKIATLREVEYTVRLLEGDEQALRGELRSAGQLSRRDVRRPVPDADFAAVLNELRTLTRRDMARLAGSGKPVTAPAIMFYAWEPPLADPGATEVFSKLAREAMVIWVIPKEMKDLMAPAFAELHGAHVVENGDGAADDIADLLISAAIAVLPQESADGS